MLAAVNNHTEAAVLLLNGGADPDLQDVSKRTALQLASAMGQSAMVDLLSGENKGELGGVSVCVRVCVCLYL